MAAQNIQYPVDVVIEDNAIAHEDAPPVVQLQAVVEEQPEQPPQPPAQQVQERQPPVPANQNELEVCELLCLASHL